MQLSTQALCKKKHARPWGDESTICICPEKEYPPGVKECSANYCNQKKIDAWEDELNEKVCYCENDYRYYAKDSKKSTSSKKGKIKAIKIKVSKLMQSILAQKKTYVPCDVLNKSKVPCSVKMQR